MSVSSITAAGCSEAEQQSVPESACLVFNYELRLGIFPMTLWDLGKDSCEHHHLVSFQGDPSIARKG